jgi:hypothetical protein
MVAAGFIEDLPRTGSRFRLGGVRIKWVEARGEGRRLKAWARWQVEPQAMRGASNPVIVGQIERDNSGIRSNRLLQVWFQGVRALPAAEKLRTKDAL